MSKSNIDNICKLANSFEFQTFALLNDRYWALQSLISLADDSLDPLRFAANEFSNFINKDISLAQFKDWVKLNSSVLDKVDVGHFYSNWNNGKKFLEINLGNNYSYVIHTTPLSVSDYEFKIKESALLQPTSVVPQLYLYKIHTFNSSRYKINTIDPKYSRYLFLAKILSDLYLASSVEEKFPELFTKFIDENKSKIDNMLRLVGPNPKLLGQGADGQAFDIGNGQVLKIFLDAYAYTHAVDAKRRLHDNPELAKTEAMIYDVGTLGEFNDNNVYYYIMEKMTPVLDLSKQESKLISKIIQYIVKEIMSEKKHWQMVKKKMSNKEPVKGFIDMGVDNIDSKIYPQLENDIDTLENANDLKRGWLKSLIEEIVLKYVTGRTDLHLGNLGITNNGEFRYYDPSYGGQGQNSINYTSFHDPNQRTA